MKIGRIKFKLRKYVLEVNRQRARRNSNPFQPSANLPQLKVDKDKEIVVRHSIMVNKNFKKEMFVEANEEIPPCRFGLSNEMDDGENPLINPGQCKGTMGLLHIDCMKHWLNTKKTVKDYNDGTCIINTWKIVSGELGKQPYPHTIHFKDKSVGILDYDEPIDEPYIVLESYPKEGSRNETQKSIYICKTRGKKHIRMGRAQQNELRIHDISISRNHAEINISKDNELYIKDVKSKFGTLVLVKSPELVPEKSETVSVYQIGRTVFVFNNTGKDQSKSFGAKICKKFGGRK